AIPAGPIRCAVRYRYRSPEAPAVVRPIDDTHTEIVWDEPQYAVAPGQAAVFYKGDEVLGGGIIASTEGVRAHDVALTAHAF
ncbi:MAG TPA: hypothetical protein EYP10_02005, partial [Armatimonadetes bacterium]|nr:hypothetical protein [Armatimonadota bacterium]